MTDRGVTKLFLKRLAPNNNSKQQIYVGPDLTSVAFLPTLKLQTSTSRSRKPGGDRTKITGSIDLHWLDDDYKEHQAPHTKLIYYPQYPEVRLSGFLQGSSWDSNGIFDISHNGKVKDRILFLGITETTKVLGFVVMPNTSLAGEVLSRHDFPRIGIFEEIVLDPALLTLDTRDKLLAELKNIVDRGWVNSRRLTSRGAIVPCNSPNCGGYTLEALLGIRPNGYSQPDFLGWELKQHGVQSLANPRIGRITLLTPEPNGGYYKEHGVLEFLRRYGYPAPTIPDRLNFTGIFRVNSRHPDRGMTLRLIGYDPTTEKITEIETGGVALVDDAGKIAAKWSYLGLLEHWKRKHNQAAYVQSVQRNTPQRQYRFGSTVRLGTETRFELFLKALYVGAIVLDPAPKATSVHSAAPKTKARNQFRINGTSLRLLYNNFETVEV